MAMVFISGVVGARRVDLHFKHCVYGYMRLRSRARLVSPNPSPGPSQKAVTATASTEDWYPREGDLRLRLHLDLCATTPPFEKYS